MWINLWRIWISAHVLVRSGGPDGRSGNVGDDPIMVVWTGGSIGSIGGMDAIG